MDVDGRIHQAFFFLSFSLYISATFYPPFSLSHYLLSLDDFLFHHQKLGWITSNYDGDKKKGKEIDHGVSFFLSTSSETPAQQARKILLLLISQTVQLCKRQRNYSDETDSSLSPRLLHSVPLLVLGVRAVLTFLFRRSARHHGNNATERRRCG